MATSVVLRLVFTEKLHNICMLDRPSIVKDGLLLIRPVNCPTQFCPGMITHYPAGRGGGRGLGWGNFAPH